MHVIIDCTTTQDQFAYAGIGQYTKNIALSLVKLYPQTKYSLLLFDEKESTLDSHINECENIKIERVGEYKVNGYQNNIWYRKNILPRVKKITTRETIYFCPYFWRNFPSDIMPTVLFIHDMILPLFGEYSTQSRLHNVIRKMQYWLTLDKAVLCKYILCNSETTKTDFLRFYPEYPEDKTIVTYLGVDLEERETNIDSLLPQDWREKGYIIYMGGGITKNKNSISVVKGYFEFTKLLKVKGEQIPYLVIAGGKFKDENLKEVKDLYRVIEDLGIKSNVVFTGFYSDENKYSLLKNAFAFIHLSTYEGFGISVAEALRAKVPTIIDKNLVYIELFDEVSSIIDSYDSKKVGSKIFDIYKNPERYKGMVERGYELSKEFTWESTAKKTYEIFEKCLEETH
ncbi:MAG TPA: glycosyltransferase family 1 protein [Candidatus Dojkabacteria bacterium]|nr:glycosyltransferase family 1 protein [Candidatus Dojkabacteria bacterium]